MYSRIKGFAKRVSNNIGEIKVDANNSKMLAIIDYMNREFNENPRYKNPKRLNRFEYQVFSQNGEDGIIAEIFKRIGTSNRFFVEFGVENGLENNTAFLLIKNFVGFWIEAKSEHIGNINQMFRSQIKEERLKIKQSFVTVENVEALFNEAKVPQEFDFLSIDIDGNDYWIWNAIEHFQPRVVAIEYNSLFPPDVACVIRYNPTFSWKGTSYFGASLKALEILANKKGYKLVGCDFRGINAFFVRNDLVKDKFLEPFTAENHFEPFRNYLQIKIGNRREFGEYEVPKEA